MNVNENKNKKKRTKRMSFITCVGLLRLLGGIDNAYERIICSLYHFVHIIIIIIILVGTKKMLTLILSQIKSLLWPTKKKPVPKQKILLQNPEGKCVCTKKTGR